MPSPLEEMINLIGRLIARRHVRELRSRAGSATETANRTTKTVAGADTEISHRPVDIATAEPPASMHEGSSG
jgi:hypothetical protein